MIPLFSQKAIDFLGGWLSGGEEVISIDDDVLKELQAVPKHSGNLVLYRATKSGDIISEKIFSPKFLTSWTYSLEVAKNFQENGLPIISALVPPEKILIDTTLLDSKFVVGKLGGFPEEEEVILYPGSMSIEFV